VYIFRTILYLILQNVEEILGFYFGKKTNKEENITQVLNKKGCRGHQLNMNEGGDLSKEKGRKWRNGDGAVGENRRVLRRLAGRILYKSKKGQDSWKRIDWVGVYVFRACLPIHYNEESGNYGKVGTPLNEW
jgi:hypothetical protein